MATRFPATLFPLPNMPLLRGRAMALRIQLPTSQPIVVANFHGHLDAYNAGHAAASVLEALDSSGDPWVFAGDHNRLQDQWPYSTALCAGRARSWDDLFVSQPHCGTRRDKNGAYTQRTIDFMIAHPELQPQARCEEIGPADHDVVMYQLRANGVPAPVPRWRRAPPLQPQPTAAFVLNDSFGDALMRGSLDSAWSMLSDAAEAALGSSQPGFRAEEPLLQSRDAGSTKSPRCQSLLERKLHRLARRAAELPTSASSDRERLLANLRNLACDLPDSHVQVTKLDWAARDTPATLHSLAEAVVQQCAAARLARWQETVQDDVPRPAAWIRADPPASPPGALQTVVALAAYWARE